MTPAVSRLLCASLLLGHVLWAGPGTWKRTVGVPSGVSRRLGHPRWHRLLQYDQPVTAAQKRALTARGLRVIQAVPPYGLIVAVPDGMESQFSGRRITAGEKVSAAIAADREGEPGYFLVEFYPDIDQADARAVVTLQGLQIIENPDLLDTQLLIRATLDEVTTLASWDEVAYVFPASEDLVQGLPIYGCRGPVTDLGMIGQYIATNGNGWDGVGRNAAQLSYFFSSYSGNIPEDQIRSEVLRAMAEWAKVAKISFRPGSSATANATINVLFADGDHGDGFAFDGPGKVLAHTFYPAPPNPEPIAGDLHFDNAEAWSVGGPVDLYTVALHELGHALGLGHSDRPNTVMYPYYTRLPGLSDEDKQAILSLYAAADATDSSPDTPPTPVGPSAPFQLSITSPANTTVTTSSATLAVIGNVAGASGPVRVAWRNDRGASGIAIGTTTWSVAAIPVNVGANTITITASDGSQTVTRTLLVTRQVALPVTIRITGVNAQDGKASLSGTATYSSGIARVTWTNSTAGTQGVAAGKDSWTAGPITLVAGTNRLTITATATSGQTATQSIQVSYSPRDTAPPSLVISSPGTTSLTTSQASITVSGTAKDSSGVASVSWTNSTGASGTAAGTDRWTATIPLVTGVNYLRVTATDSAGNTTWRAISVTRR